MLGFIELILIILGTVLPCLGILVILGIIIVVILLIQNNRQNQS